MHDVGDRKLWPDLLSQEEFILAILGSCNVLTTLQRQRIAKVAASVSFKGSGVEDTPPDLESKCVMDADRLDAMGAIGIARCFAFGGATNRAIFDPDVLPEVDQTEDQYRNNKSTSINHFFEKLLLLKNRLQTNMGRRMGLLRHLKMLEFLAQFEWEWGGDLLATRLAKFAAPAETLES